VDRREELWREMPAEIDPSGVFMNPYQVLVVSSGALTEELVLSPGMFNA
jgi:hypothetical protein